MLQNSSLALYGGSFNPVHQGHLKTAQFVLDSLPIEQIFLMPNASPPHKNTVKLPFATRVAMLNLALEDLQDSRISISLQEQDSSIAHYTWDTLEQIKKLNPHQALYFIIGMDSLLSLDTWKNGLDLIKQCNIIVLLRPSFSLNELKSEIAQNVLNHIYRENEQETEQNNVFVKIKDLIVFKQLTKQSPKSPYHYILLNSPEFDFSSTQIRQNLKLLANNEDKEQAVNAQAFLQQALSPNVLKYIQEHQLYI